MNHTFIIAKLEDKGAIGEKPGCKPGRKKEFELSAGRTYNLEDSADLL